jgi:hypothetical protein
MSAPHDQPTMTEIVRAVSQWWAQASLSPDSRRRQFEIRVALNALDIVTRELPVQAQHRHDHQRRLSTLGHQNDASLAMAIRAGAYDNELPGVIAVLQPSIRDKVSVANPRWLEPD